MAAIFISYRRKDSGWAAWLADNLQERYDVFFDTDKIDYGDRFPKEIVEALNEIKIFLAIIGSAWIDKEHLKRLSNPEDWVRREIEAALSRSNVRVVPVLFGDVNCPTDQDLPDEISTLAQQNAFTFSHVKRKTDLKLFISKLDNWLRQSAYSASVRKPIPHVVPHLCDRLAQEDDLVQIFTKEQEYIKNPVVILHGHKWEEHIGFLERLQYRHVLGELLGANELDIGVTVNNLQWNVDQAADGQYERVLSTAIKRNILESLTASDNDIYNFFQNIRQPHVLMLQVTWSDYQRCGEGLFEGLVQAWRNVFQVKRKDADPKAIEPTYTILLWINVSYDDSAQALTFDNILKDIKEQTYNLLPILKPLQEGDLHTWIALKDVKHYVAGCEGRVLSIIEDEQRCIEKGKIHMRCFIEAIQEILT
jgi:hypothetical protein